MRGWLLFLCFRFLTAQDYVCSVADFRRMVGNVQTKVEAYYSKVVTSSAELADTLAYSSAHPNYFPGVYNVNDLRPCPNATDQFSVRGPGRLLGIHVLNRTRQGIKFNLSEVDAELDFVTPIANFLPTIMSHNNDSITISVVGLTQNCSTYYFYPPRDLCGSQPMTDVCAYYNDRYNVFSKIEDLQQDLDNGGHWSELYTDALNNLVITYSIPVKDSTGKFRAQLGFGVNNREVQRQIFASRPSRNGFTFMMTNDGNIIYAPQGAIDILFGRGLNLKKLSAQYNGYVLRNEAITLDQSFTVFSDLPEIILASQDANGSAFVSTSNTTGAGYYVAWSRFEQTLRTWFMVGISPRGDIDEAAIWNITPGVVEVTLTDLKPEVDLKLYATNRGLLPFAFNVGSSPSSLGITVNSSLARYNLQPNQTAVIDFNIVMDLAQVGEESFTTHFVTPFFTGSAGYGPCFRPQVSEMIIHVVRQKHYISSLWSQIVIYLLAAITAVLVIVAFVLLVCFRFSPPVLALAPRLTALILFGLLMALGGVAANIAQPTVPLCETVRWLFHVGYCIVVATVIAKNYRNRRIFTSKKLQVVALSDYQLMAFVGAVVLVDLILLTVGIILEPYQLMPDGQCVLQGLVVYSILIATKILLWLAAFWNTLSITNVPATFADTRLNGVFIVIAILAIIRLGLQLSGALANYIGIQVFLGSLFIWFGIFLVWGHLLLKLRYGYVTIARPRSSTKHGSISLSLTQPKLKERLEALLAEIEAQSTRLLMDKNNAIESVKANQRLMFEVRAELLAINTQAHLVDEELERFLPSSIKSAFDKFGPAMARRMELGRPPVSKPRPKSEIRDEAKQLLSVESTSPVATSAYNTPSAGERGTFEDPHEDRSYVSINRAQFPHPAKNISSVQFPANSHVPIATATAAIGEVPNLDQEQYDDTSSTQDEDTPLQSVER